MKMMISLISLFLISKTSIAFEFEPYLYKDSLTLYMNKEPAILKNAIKIFDNANLTNSPVFELQSDGFVKDKIKYSFKEIVSCSAPKLVDSKCISKMGSVDFFRITSIGQVYLTVDSMANGIAKISDKGKNYYLKLSPNDFVNSKWPEWADWRLVIGNEANSYVKDLIKNDLYFADLVNEIEKCIKAKNIECLSKLSSDSAETITKKFKYRQIAEDPKLCKEFWSYLGDTDEQVMDAMIAESKVKVASILWPKIDKLIHFESKDVDILLRTREFKKASLIEVEKKYNGVLACKNIADLKMTFVKNTDGKWKFESFTTYETPAKPD